MSSMSQSQGLNSLTKTRYLRNFLLTCNHAPDTLENQSCPIELKQRQEKSTQPKTPNSNRTGPRFTRHPQQSSSPKHIHDKRAPHDHANYKKHNCENGPYESRQSRIIFVGILIMILANVHNRERHRTDLDCTKEEWSMVSKSISAEATDGSNT